MASKGQAQDLKQSSSSAILGLLRSIAPDAVPEDGRKLNEENIKRINENLVALLGKGEVELNHHDENVGDELVNEDGLPIIDIAEPAEDAESLGAGTTSIAQEDKLIPLGSLSMSQRERLRQERERILDMLEEEEKFDEQRERERMLEEKKEAIRKRTDEATKERDRTVAAKEMQKKMGRALLGTKITDKDKNEIAVSKPVPSDSAKPKKSVSFVAESMEGRHSPERETWGDISLATLRPTNRPTLLSKVEEGRQPMKRRVVERKPVGQVSIRQQGPGDSDDESNPDDEEDKDSLDGGKNLPAEQFPEDSASESDVTNESLEDLDFAQHQREITLEYYAKRGIIGQAAAQALVSHSHTEEDEKEITLDTGVTEPHSSKPSLSHFKASKLAASFNSSIPSQTTSLEGSVLPASSAKTIQKTIRMGKLDSKNQLVGADSGSEGEDEVVQQVLELLGKGEVYNVGPEGNQTFYAVPPPEKAETDTAVAVNTTTLPPLTKPKTSKFKVDLSQAGPPKADQSQAKSITSSPTASTTLPAAAAVVERRPPGIVKTTSSAGSAPMPSTIVDSPSFPAPKSTSSGEARKPGPQNYMSSTPFSMIVESPSFPRATGAPQSKPDTLASATIMPSRAASSQSIAPRRPARPPAVMSSVVREKSSQPVTEGIKPTGPTEPQPPKAKKVSRFLAERT